MFEISDVHGSIVSKVVVTLIMKMSPDVEQFEVGQFLHNDLCRQLCQLVAIYVGVRLLLTESCDTSCLADGISAWSCWSVSYLSSKSIRA